MSTKPGEDHAAILRLLLFTGARKSEILNLTWGEVDLERGRILLPWHRSKTGEKMIPLSLAAVKEITRRPRTGPYVFPAARGEGPTVGLYKTWDQVRETAKLDGVRIHDLRHSFASFAAADGVSLYLIGKALGHRQATTTERYAHLADDPIRAVAEQVSARFLPFIEGEADVVDKRPFEPVPPHSSATEAVPRVVPRLRLILHPVAEDG